MVEKFKKILNKYNIDYSYIDKEIINPDSTVFPVIINNQKIYFKVLKDFDINKIQIEIEIVNKLRSSLLNVQKYFSTNGNSIFLGDNLCVYGTYDAGIAIPLEKITDNNIKMFLTNIAQMHNNLRLISVNNKHFKLESDDERFYDFYENNLDFFEKYNLKKYIKDEIKFEKYKLDYTYIHADLNFRNITQNGTIIDFTDLKVGYIEDDLGKFFQNVLNTKYNKPEKLNEYVNLYENFSNYKINKKRLKFSIFYRLFYRFYKSLQEKDDLNEYNNLILALEKLKNWEV